MLYLISDKIKSGTGIDFNYKNINSCNKITNYKKISNLCFYIFDLEKEDLESQEVAESIRMGKKKIQKMKLADYDRGTSKSRERGRFAL